MNENPPTAILVASKRVNGMGEPDPKGSYIIVSAKPSNDRATHHYKISLGGAEVLAEELLGALQP